MARGSLPIAVGVVAIGLRSARHAEPPAAPGSRPDGDGPWIGVGPVGRRAARRRAARRSFGSTASPPVIVAATLPWYPPVVPGDRVGLGRPDPAATRRTTTATTWRRIGAVGTLRAETLEVLPADGLARPASSKGFAARPPAGSTGRCPSRRRGWPRAC